MNADKISLTDLQQRLEATDLVPSRVVLRENLAFNLKALAAQGIANLADLRNELKNPRRLAALAKATGMDEQYLMLLRREIEGYFPKPVALKTFSGLPGDEIAKLEQNRIEDTAQFYEAAGDAQKRAELSAATGISPATLETLAQLSDLMRVQWVSPTFAQVLLAAGYDSAAKIAAADAETLCERLASVNAGDKFFKGKIGLRDIKRLILAASYV